MARAEQLLAIFHDPKMLPRVAAETRVQIAQVEATLALAAAIAGQQRDPSNPWGPTA